MFADLLASPLAAFLLFIGLLVTVAVAVQFLTEGAGNPLEERLRRMKEGPKSVAASGNIFQPLLELGKKLIAPVRLFTQHQADKVRESLVAAGYRSEESLLVFKLAKLVMAIAFAVGALVVLFVTLEERTQLSYLAIPGAALFGSIFVDMVVDNLAKRRRVRIENDLPDVIEMLLICLRASMTFEAALQRIILEARGFMPQILDEFELALTEMQILQDRATALKRLAKRVGTTSLHSFTSTVAQAERFGTSLVESFEVLSDEMRKTRIFRAEAWAAKAPVLMTIPMVLFLLPVLFIVMMGPAVIQILDSLKGLNLGAVAG